MARYPRLEGFEPEITKRLGARLLRVKAGTDERLWVTAVMRKTTPCGICRRTINKGEHGWRELGQTSLYRSKRVCTQCWPDDKEPHEHDQQNTELSVSAVNTGEETHASRDE